MHEHLRDPRADVYTISARALNCPWWLDHTLTALEAAPNEIVATCHSTGGRWHEIVEHQEGLARKISANLPWTTRQKDSCPQTPSRRIFSTHT